MEDSIDKRDEEGNIKYVGEYLIVFNEFVEICKKYDLHLVENKNFTEFYKDYIKIDFYKRLSGKMLKDLNNTNIKKQWEIIQLYKMFVFRKGTPNEKEKYIPYITKNKITFDDYNPVFEKGTLE